MPQPRTMTIAEPFAPGDIALPPIDATGLSEGQLARAMVEALHDSAPQSGSDALKYLRMLFPASPLTVRVTALTATMRR